MQTHVQIPSDIVELHPNCFALEVEGDCMMPSIQPGSVVIVDPDTMPPASEMAAVEVNGGLYLCRPLRIMGQVVMLTDNPTHRNVTLPASAARIVGTVVWVEQVVEERGEKHAEAVVH